MGIINTLIIWLFVSFIADGLVYDKVNLSGTQLIYCDFIALFLLAIILLFE